MEMEMEIGPYSHPPPHSLHPPTTLLHTKITFADSIYIILHPPQYFIYMFSVLQKGCYLIFVHNVKNFIKMDMEKEMEITHTNPSTPTLTAHHSTMHQSNLCSFNFNYSMPTTSTLLTC